MAIQSIAFTVYPVTDMARARAFYEGQLGLKAGECFGETWCEYDLGASTFAVTTFDMGHLPGSKGAVVGFEVDDLETFLARLKQEQVPFITDVMETPVCRMVVIEDPDHNHITIHKRK